MKHPKNKNFMVDFQLLQSTFLQCTSEDFDHGTECLLLAMKYVGVHGIILDGSPDLWKVWALPEYYMPDHSNLNQRFYR